MSDCIKKGLSECEKITESPEALGMSNAPDKKGQTPKKTPETTVSDSRGTFKFK
jgi:hypothetical protein